MKNVTPRELAQMKRVALRPVTVIGEQVGFKMSKGEAARMAASTDRRIAQDIARRLADAILEPVAYFTKDGSIVELVQPTTHEAQQPDT